MDWKALFFSADGRLGRERFWIGWAIVFGVNLVAGWLPVLGLLVHLASLYAWVCLYAKRLHDMGRTGWLQLIPAVAAAASLILGMVMFGWAMVAGLAAWAGYGGFGPGVAMLGAIGGMLMVLSVGGLVNLVFLIWIGATPGQAGGNAYGPDPKEAALSDVF